ncbi:hypothetical protein [Sphingomonas sp. 28-63-12]|uniref:hypothetical protein n=1 Tax=Sphingomonas sp. 28-63-12 TaxID=1970434 RepID=UPI0035A83387
MAFFGAFFAALTMYWHGKLTGLALAWPYLVFALIGVAALCVIRLPGTGLVPSERVKRALIWSSAAEGIGIFVASNIVINVHHPDWLLPAMAVIVGLHFLPIAYAASSSVYYILGGVLIAAAGAGFVLSAPLGGVVAGVMAASSLWIAAIFAVRRDLRAKRSSAVAG